MDFPWTPRLVGMFGVCVCVWGGVFWKFLTEKTCQSITLGETIDWLTDGLIDWLSKLIMQLWFNQFVIKVACDSLHNTTLEVLNWNKNINKNI